MIPPALPHTASVNIFWGWWNKAILSTSPYPVKSFCNDYYDYSALSETRIATDILQLILLTNERLVSRSRVHSGPMRGQYLRLVSSAVWSVKTKYKKQLQWSAVICRGEWYDFLLEYRQTFLGHTHIHLTWRIFFQNILKILLK